MFDNTYIESIDEVIGNNNAISFMKRFASDFESGSKRKPLMIFGPSGIGKTLSTHMLAKQFKWNIVEMNASDYRDRQSIESLLQGASNTRSLFGKRNLILLDEIDDLTARFDNGASAAISSIVEGSRNPVIFIANNMWDQSISFLRSKTDPVEFKKLSSSDISNILSNMLKKLGRTMPKEMIDMVANRSSGDARSAINDMLVVLDSDDNMIDSIGLRDRKSDVFATLDKIFLSNTLAAPMRAVGNTDVDNDMMIKWIDENIPHRYNDIKDMYFAYEYLSDATSFSTKASRSQYYTYWRYMSAMMSGGVALAKSRHPDTSRRYSFPKIISDLSKSKPERQGDAALAKKLQKQMHLSISEIKSNEMRLMARMAAGCMKSEEDKEKVYDFFMNKFEMSEKEVDSLIMRAGSRQVL